MIMEMKLDDEKIYIDQKMMKSIESKLFWVFLVEKTVTLFCKSI